MKKELENMDNLTRLAACILIVTVVVLATSLIMAIIVTIYENAGVVGILSTLFANIVIASVIRVMVWYANNITS